MISNPLFAFKAMLSWTLTFLAAAAFAQAPTDTEVPKPALPTKLQYTSAIGAYQAYEDQPVQSWREANDRVGRVGGWRVYAKEIKNGKPAADPHAGHHGGGQ